MAQHKSRSQRRLRVRTPSGRNVVTYERRKKGSGSCSNCGLKLAGVSQTRFIAASKRNPSRPYGGVLCSKCSRVTIKDKVRANA